MSALTRRHFVQSLAAATGAMSMAMPALAKGAARPLRMLLNTSFSGPQAWIFLAQDKGYLAAEGIDLTLTPGAGAYTAAPRMAGSDFDIGYGDINSLIEVAARDPQRAPVGVFATFNASPSTIAVDAAGPIRSPRDLPGRTITGHASDVALKTFSAFCQSSGIDAGRVKITTFGGGMRGQVESMLASKSVDGMFGYVSTIASALAEGGVDLNSRVRHLRFADHVPDLYGSTLMASQRLIRDEPGVVRGLVRALNRGLNDIARDPAAGIAAVMRRAPYADEKAEMLRLKTTFRVEMAHADIQRLGLGAVDAQRLARSIALIAATNGLPRQPATAAVFTDAFLPPSAERVRALAI